MVRAATCPSAAVSRPVLAARMKQTLSTRTDGALHPTAGLLSLDL